MTASFRAGLTAALPTVLGYASIGLACGIVGAQSGISWAEMGLMSLLVYTGSGQFAICALVLAGADLTTSLVTFLLLQLRNLLLNLHAATIFGALPFPQQLLLASQMTDESYGLMLGHELATGRVPFGWMLGNNLAGYLSWLVFTVLGAVLGGLLPNPQALGVDFALVVMFVAIFAGQWEALGAQVARHRLLAILATVAGVYLAAAYVLTGALAMLLATLAGCLVGVMTDVD